MMVGIEFGDEEKRREKKFESETRIHRVFVFLWGGPSGGGIGGRKEKFGNPHFVTEHQLRSFAAERRGNRGVWRGFGWDLTDLQHPASVMPSSSCIYRSLP